MPSTLEKADTKRLSRIVENYEKRGNKRAGRKRECPLWAYFAVALPAAGATFAALIIFFGNPSANGAGGNTQLKACLTSAECCSGAGFEEKKCKGNTTCVDNKCELKECTSGCCVSGLFKDKLCPQGLECKAYECVKPACPSECCNGTGEYSAKECPNNLLCSNNSCVERKCTQQCCADKEGFEEKLCQGEQRCVGGQCVKPECPARCCPQNDPNYVEKKCPSHQVCIGKVCVDRF